MKLLKFYLDTCQPCKTITPIIEDIISEDDLELININVKDEPDLAEKYGVKSVPTLVLIESDDNAEDFAVLRAPLNADNIVDFLDDNNV